MEPILSLIEPLVPDGNFVQAEGLVFDSRSKVKEMKAL